MKRVFICETDIVPVNWYYQYDSVENFYWFKLALTKNYNLRHENEEISFFGLNENCTFRTKRTADPHRMAIRVYNKILQWPTGEVSRFIRNPSLIILGLKSNISWEKNLSQKFMKHKVFDCEIRENLDSTLIEPDTLEYMIRNQTPKLPQSVPDNKKMVRGRRAPGGLRLKP